MTPTLDFVDPSDYLRAPFFDDTWDSGPPGLDFADEPRDHAARVSISCSPDLSGFSDALRDDLEWKNHDRHSHRLSVRRQLARQNAYASGRR